MELFNKYRKYIIRFGVPLLILFAAIVFASSAPSDFPSGGLVSIPAGTGVSGAAHKLKDLRVVRSAFLFRVYVTLLHGGKGVQEGYYRFEKPQSALRAAYRLAFGIQGLEKIKITIPEGSNSTEMGAIIKKAIPDFNEQEFVALAKAKEGYLFPETYFFNEKVEPSEIIRAMGATFDEKVAAVGGSIAASGKSLKDIITMASILEEEVRTTEDRRIVSGILWKRIDAGMPLQVDAPFYYIFGKGSSQLSEKDLAAKSPYNTYLNKGLPPGPISNPSLDAIVAAAEPVKTKYWFYLSDKKGVTHYAETHDQHVANKDRYLR